MLVITRSWKNLFDRQLIRPNIQFITGMRHSVHPGWYTRFHTHPHIEAVFHPTGRGVTRLSRQRAVEFREGSVILYGVNETHDQTIQLAGEDLCLQWAVPRRVAPSGILHLPRLSDLYIISEFQSLSRVQSLSNATQQALLDLRASSMLLNLLKVILTQSEDISPGERHVSKAEEYIRLKFHSIRSMEEVATHVGLSQARLRYLFKKLRGYGMASFLNQIRVERACSLLMNSGLPLKQVARQCGFSDEYYFSAVFHRHAHVSPGKYRRRA